jgi:hypothetical protein
MTGGFYEEAFTACTWMGSMLCADCYIACDERMRLWGQIQFQFVWQFDIACTVVAEKHNSNEATQVGTH